MVNLPDDQRLESYSHTSSPELTPGAKSGFSDLPNPKLNRSSQRYPKPEIYTPSDTDIDRSRMVYLENLVSRLSISKESLDKAERVGLLSKTDIESYSSSTQKFSSLLSLYQAKSNGLPIEYYISTESAYFFAPIVPLSFLGAPGIIAGIAIGAVATLESVVNNAKSADISFQDIRQAFNDYRQTVLNLNSSLDKNLSDPMVQQRLCREITSSSLDSLAFLQNLRSFGGYIDTLKAVKLVDYV